MSMPQCSILQQRLSKETSKETQETMSSIDGREKVEGDKVEMTMTKTHEEANENNIYPYYIYNNTLFLFSK